MDKIDANQVRFNQNVLCALFVAPVFAHFQFNLEVKTLLIHFFAVNYVRRKDKGYPPHVKVSLTDV
jgi:hypothetical protein